MFKVVHYMKYICPLPLIISNINNLYLCSRSCISPSPLSI